ncbi:tetratricopeptide repeat protein [Streptomyces sp. SAJ15]|uniref:tetratricopeptide repeat protein n=1 Tax=Streptomyces sp. SAJ15 TaxID=2011095 RepID=UPI00118532EB|nr:tetratricopeptide repeat protein [Streptomyces sp. SAJ15]TVL91955.1 transcriptional regulator [Streptomyces sp. SAJ15]
MGAREPNQDLRRLHSEAGWTLRQFAQAVNRVGTECGTPTTYSAQTAHTWLKGHLPSEERRALILEALSRRLVRRVRHTDAGFPATSEANASPGIDTVDEIIGLERRAMVDTSRRSMLGIGLYSAALAIPGWQDVRARMNSIKMDPHARIGRPDVQAVSAMTDRLSDLDDDFGGQYVRPMAVAFFEWKVAPYLRATASGKVRQEMLSAAAFLCYLTGWMAEDEEAQGLAQQYYVKGLELAGASGDRMTYCHILRGMSVQAANLGHGAPAVRLANAAAEASPESNPRMRAFLAGQQAHAYALAGERIRALNSLREAERSVEQAESGYGTFGGYNPATLAYHTAQVRHALGDVKGGIVSLTDHFRLRQANDKLRTELIFGSLLAERQLKVGHLEAACARWSKVLDAYPHMHSGRLDSRVADIPKLLSPYEGNAAARELRQRVRELRPGHEVGNRHDPR